MIGAYRDSTKRRLIPNGEGVTGLSSVEGHFDGKRSLFVLDAGPSSKALAVGTTINTGLPFGQVDAINGSVRFEPSVNGENKPGIRIIHLDTAPIAQAPFCSYPMRDGGFGTVESWTIGFVYTWKATINGGGSDAEIFSFTCDNVEARFYLYPNGVILWSLTVDKNGASEIYNSVGGATAPSAFTDVNDVYAMVFSHNDTDGFYFRNINLTNFIEATYDVPQGYKPVGYTSSKNWVEGNGTCIFGADANFRPSETRDFTIHEAFYTSNWIQPIEITSLFTDWYRKWVVKS